MLPQIHITTSHNADGINAAYNECVKRRDKVSSVQAKIEDLDILEESRQTVSKIKNELLSAQQECAKSLIELMRLLNDAKFDERQVECGEFSPQACKLLLERLSPLLAGKRVSDVAVTIPHSFRELREHIYSLRSGDSESVDFSKVQGLSERLQAAQEANASREQFLHTLREDRSKIAEHLDELRDEFSSLRASVKLALGL